MSRDLMAVYHRLGRRAAIAHTYGRCQAALNLRLGSTPSAETERLFKAFLAD